MVGGFAIRQAAEAFDIVTGVLTEDPPRLLHKPSSHRGLDGLKARRGFVS